MATSELAAADVGGRRALMDATVAAIEEDGLAGVSLRAITRRAAVSHAAPAYHFGDKAGLFTAVALEGFVLLQTAMNDALGEARRRSAVGRMEALAVAYVNFATEHRAHFEVMFRPELLHPHDQELLRAGLTTFDILRTAVRSAQEEGFGTRWNVDDLALLAWSMIHGVVQLTVNDVVRNIGFRVQPVDLAARLTRLANEAFVD